MSQEQINILLDNVKGLRKDVETLRNEMHTEHKQVIERIVKLESSVDFIKRVCWGGIGGLVLILAKVYIPLLL